VAETQERSSSHPFPLRIKRRPLAPAAGQRNRSFAPIAGAGAPCRRRSSHRAARWRVVGDGGAASSATRRGSPLLVGSEGRLDLLDLCDDMRRPWSSDSAPLRRHDGDGDLDLHGYGLPRARRRPQPPPVSSAHRYPASSSASTSGPPPTAPSPSPPPDAGSAREGEGAGAAAGWREARRAGAA
jgi:hypothetical protein